jgi:hypothetical protein
MSLLPSTLLNATSNEDQTLEIHSEILEPLAHSQTISRFEIPHKNILDSDSVLVWNVYNAGGANDRTGANQTNTPRPWGGLYNTIYGARLFVNGKIISELQEVGKYLTMKNHFTPHEVKTEVNDLFSYSDHNLRNTGGLMDTQINTINNTPGSKRLGPQTAVAGHDYPVEASLKLHQLFPILKDAQLDTNNIEGKIMIEIDWEPRNNSANSDVISVGAAVVPADRAIQIATPRLILDFLTYNAEVQAQVRNAIYGDGPGVNMPFREVALVRKNLVANAGQTSTDMSIGMTGRAIQKIWVAKVMNCANNDVNTGATGFLGDSRSDLLGGQSWNVRVNDLMIYDRDVDNRAEEFNYLQQTGEKQFTCPPQTFESRSMGQGDRPNYVANDNMWVDASTCAVANASTNGATNNVPNADLFNGVGNLNGAGMVRAGGALQIQNLRRKVCGRLNYLGVNLAKYKDGAESPLNAMRVGSTPVVFTLNKNGANDADTTAQSGNVYFWVEYLKLMNLKNGQISVVDL